MNRAELLKALKRLKVQTGSLACLGCGHEDGCGIHGCAILRAAVENCLESDAIRLTFNKKTQVWEKLEEPYATIEVATKEDFDKLKKLWEAKADGRLVELPCRLGDTVYCIYTGTSGKNHTIMRDTLDYHMIPFIGKSIFLTREEAEVRIKEIQECDSDD